MENGQWLRPILPRITPHSGAYGFTNYLCQPFSIIATTLICNSISYLLLNYPKVNLQVTNQYYTESLTASPSYALLNLVLRSCPAFVYFSFEHGESLGTGLTVSGNLTFRHKRPGYKARLVGERGLCLTMIALNPSSWTNSVKYVNMGSSLDLPF